MAKLGPWADVAEALDALKIDDRPKAPTLPQATDADRRQGRTLAEIHKMHLGELLMTQRLLDQIGSGERPPAALVQALPDMKMTRNLEAFGNLCGRNCMVINSHHNIEEFDTFKRVEAGGHAGINEVVAKLREEHKVIHALIEQLYSAAVILVETPGPDAYADAARIFAQFKAVVQSHFGYEETELQEALGVFRAI